MTASNISRYAIWQLRDFLIDRATAILLIGALVGSQAIIGARLTGFTGRSDANAILLRMISGLGILFAVIAINGQVSTDRTRGYFRFLFAKPVSPAAFYAQQFAVWFVGLLMTVGLLIGIFAAFAGPVSPWESLWFVSLVYIAFGGTGFFLSTVTRRDWLAVIGLWTVTQILHSLYDDRGIWFSRLFVLLPPVQQLDDAGKALTGHGSVAPADIAWILGYSALFFALGILVLHRRPFHS